MTRKLVLLTLLILALALVSACGPAAEEAAPTATAVPPTATAVPPTDTPVPPTATPVPPTDTPVPPTATPVPPTATPEPPQSSAVLDDATAYYSSGPKTISADDLFANLNDGDAENDPFILSVRALEDDTAGHIPGAYNVSIKELFTPDVLADLPTDQPIVVYCYTGQTAAQATAALNVMGYDASSLVFGMSGWTNDPTAYVKRFDAEKVARQYPTSTEEVAWPEASGETPDALGETSVAAAEAYFTDGGPKLIAADDVYNNLNDGDPDNDPFIISVRSAEDYAKGHVPGAVWASPKELFTADMLAKLPADRPIVTYCYTGQTAGQVTAGLNLLGYDAASMTYGMSGWSDDPEVYVKRFDPETTPRDFAFDTGAPASLAAGKMADDSAAAGNEVMDAAVAYFSAGPKTIAADALFENLNDGDETNDPYVISVRKPEDYAVGHIPGAVNISPADLFNPDVMATLPTDQPIVAYCYTGQSASQVTSALNMAGYDASNLVFGMSSWTTDPEVYKTRFEPETAKSYPTTTDPFEATGEYAAPSPLAATVAEAANTYFDAGMKTIKADALYENLNDGDETNDPYIISVRSADDYGKGHLPGAVWEDPKALFTPEGLATLPTDQPIVVYCYTGQTASQVTSALNLLGYDASSLVFGMSSWSDDPDVFAKRFDAAKAAHDYATEASQ
ncbi:MAG: rhodanese-like domain-containing protein [Anaerolineae bacterium]|nr:rhodanese-like domain-containing protein [Anaerolineae bacterium]